MKPNRRRLKRLSMQAQWRVRPWFILNADFNNAAVWAKGSSWSVSGPAADSLILAALGGYTYQLADIGDLK